jgi:hypothetical protein
MGASYFLSCLYVPERDVVRSGLDEHRPVRREGVTEFIVRAGRLRLELVRQFARSEIPEEGVSVLVGRRQPAIVAGEVQAFARLLPRFEAVSDLAAERFLHAEVTVVGATREQAPVR